MIKQTKGSCDSESSGDDAPAAPLRDSDAGDSLRESWDGDARVDSDLERDVDNFGADPPSDDEVPPIRNPEPPSASKRRRATMEEVEDEDERWVQDFPQEFEAGAVLEECKTEFEKLRQKQKAAGEEPWSPFKSEEEWEMARWLMTSGLSQSKTDDFLKLNSVRNDVKPSFHNNRAFLKHIDALPEGPGWRCFPFDLEGDERDADGVPKVETVYMWYRNPVECIQELLGNPAFKKMGFAPRRVFKDVDDEGEGKNREYNEMWTAEWWWQIQNLLPKGSTLCPIIISSDKTQLTRFSGDQQAWPVYLTIGDIDKETRRSPSSHATVLIGYIPVTKLEIFKKASRQAVAHQLFHDCMRVLLAPLKEAGEKGVRMDCADDEQSKGQHPPEFKTQNLRPVVPFWANLPHCDIFSCMTPDILHELHNGLFGDHLVSWTSEAMAGLGPEIDVRFRAMTPHPSLRHFKKGISLTTQWTGTEHKNMEKVFLGILPGATEPGVQRAVKGVVDFIHYAHFETHCDESLAKMDAAWAAFHSNKVVFKELEIRDERDYTPQMTVWLRRQEAVYKFGTYLQWAAPGYIAKPATVDDDDEMTSIPPPPEPPLVPDDSDDEGELEDSPPSVPVYVVAKKPGFPNVTATSISTDFRAPDFLLHLSAFLHSKSIIPPIELSPSSKFPVYKRLSLTLPAVSAVTSKTVGDTITAVKAEGMKITPTAVKPATHGRFDTILVRTHPRGDGASPVDGLRVARVKVIFRLPEFHGTYPEALAYIEWFRPLTQPVPDIGMYQVAPSTRNHRPNSTIIPITNIVRSCHLIPVFGHVSDTTWTSARVLDQSPSFYLNPYLRHHDFYLFRYLVDLYNSKKEEEERRVRMRRMGRAAR
ncbi:hypothetical protein B0H16DRAFT_1822559 [Mycena metata]|uniref:Uncharacterized protein n=1 Tax=Mycena metata TaxID=1033252 RepID=A0AAD7NFN7_9AGAR|nr:hypothetical protein B0H16DRAFT_1822559 [Mycena metata]